MIISVIYKVISIYFITVFMGQVS